MAPTKAVAKDGAVKKVDDGKTKQKRGKPRNYDLGHGIYRFSRTKMFHKTARYKFLKKKTPKTVKPKKIFLKEKPIGGEKNGGKRLVLVKKRPRSYPTSDKINKHPSKRTFKQHKRYTRKSLEPGKVLILLAGPHRGKRVVLLKVLDSGLLLITGPFICNGCPVRRINQNFVIATTSKVDLPENVVPETVNDEYFRRVKAPRPKGEDVFAAPKQKYKASETRKKDQSTIDKIVLQAIKKREDRAVFLKYLGSMFGLKRTQYPHRLKF